VSRFECSGPRCKATAEAELEPSGRLKTPPGWRWIWCHAGAFIVCGSCNPPTTGTCFEEDGAVE
jgi:hypothetical protein